MAHFLLFLLLVSRLILGLLFVESWLFAQGQTSEVKIAWAYKVYFAYYGNAYYFVRYFNWAVLFFLFSFLTAKLR
jgi:hypothetical protein